MKKKLLSAIAALSFAIAGQTQPAIKAEGSTYHFKPKEGKYIDMRKLKDSTYSFTSADGITLWLTVQNKIVIKTRVFKASGEEITIILDTTR